MEKTLAQTTENRGTRALLAVSTVLAAAFLTLHLYIGAVCRTAVYGDPRILSRLIAGAGFLLSAAIGFAGVRLLKTKRLIKLAPFIALFGLIMSIFGAFISPYEWVFYHRYLHIDGFSIYLPCFAMLTAFMAGIAGTYRSGWKWQSLPATLALLVLPCIALSYTHSLAAIIVIFFTWFFFMIALARGGRMQTPWYVLLGVGVLFIAAFSYAVIEHADGLERLSTVFTRGQSDPLGEGYVRSLADQVMQNARVFGAADEWSMEMDWGALPLSLYVAHFEFPFELLFVLAKCGWVAFIAVIALLFVIPAALLFASRRAPNAYAKYFAVFTGLYLLGKTGLGLFSLLFSDISAPLPFFDFNAGAWMDIFLIFAAYTLLLSGETDLAETERDYDASVSLKEHLRARFWPSFDDITGFDDAEIEAEFQRRRALTAFLKQAAENRAPAEGGAVYISADERSAAAAGIVAEALRAAGKPCDCFTGNPVGGENEAQSREALGRATVYVRLTCGVNTPEDPWGDAENKIAVLLMPAMTVWIPSHSSEAAAATANGFAERLIGFLSCAEKEAENASPEALE